MRYSWRLCHVFWRLLLYEKYDLNFHKPVLYVLLFVVKYDLNFITINMEMRLFINSM